MKPVEVGETEGFRRCLAGLGQEKHQLWRTSPRPSQRCRCRVLGGHDGKFYQHGRARGRGIVDLDAAAQTPGEVGRDGEPGAGARDLVPDRRRRSVQALEDPARLVAVDPRSGIGTSTRAFSPSTSRLKRAPSTSRSELESIPEDNLEQLGDAPGFALHHDGLVGEDRGERDS